MKNNQQLLAIAIASVLSMPALATNGTNMTGVSAQSVAMGGTGVAAYYGAENVIVNPAMIGKGQGTEFSFGGTLFKPNVSNNGLGGDSAKATSSADTFMIPTISLSSRINNNLTFGIGMYGTSGMGVNYKNATGANGNLMSAQSQLQIMRVIPTIAYNDANYGIGFSPIIQYGSLDINYNPGMDLDPVTVGTQPGNVGSGTSSSLNMGYSLGGYFDATKDLTFGASYISAINGKYKNQLSTASAPFVNPAYGVPSAYGDDLEQPAEIKLGAAYTMGQYLITGDVKQIRWSEAKGYKDFGWQDQNVIAVGLRYSGSGYWVGVGYNKADNPIKQQNGNTYAGAVTNMFNNMFFPATTEQHFSVGGGYNLTNAVSLDGAIMYAPEVTTTANTTGVTTAFNGGTPAPSTNTTSHSQMAYTVSVKYKF